MKKSLLVFLSLFLAIPVLAQEPLEPEVQHLIDIVVSLRQVEQKEQVWNQASQALAEDKKWTIMDEIVPHENECLLSDRKVNWFALNRILSQRMGYEDNKTRGDFNNGEDPNFSYSLIERSVKANSTVEYELKSREGEQVFVVVPSNMEINNLDVKIYRGNAMLAKGQIIENGNVYVKVDAKKGVKASDTLRLVIANKSEKSLAIVIINHNTRKK